MGKSVAIVGASSDRSKFGNKAVRAFLQAGWTVYPVNPKIEEVEGLKCYQSLADLPEKVNWISVYLPPAVTQSILGEIAAAEPEDVYFNPGAATPEIVKEAQKLGINAHSACSIVAVGLSPSMFEDR